MARIVIFLLGLVLPPRCLSVAPLDRRTWRRLSPATSHRRSGPSGVPLEPGPREHYFPSEGLQSETDKARSKLTHTKSGGFWPCLFVSFFSLGTKRFDYFLTELRQVIRHPARHQVSIRHRGLIDVIGSSVDQIHLYGFVARSLFSVH